MDPGGAVIVVVFVWGAVEEGLEGFKFGGVDAGVGFEGGAVDGAVEEVELEVVFAVKGVD